MGGRRIIRAVQDDLKTDYNWNRAGTLLAKGARALPTGTANYVVDKVPMVSWLPRYEPRWLINDFIAGLTVGLMLIPQGLSYAKIATIPIEYGLAASWLPSAIYAFMGTSKDTSVGPTSLIGLLTAEVVTALKSPEHSPQQIASAVAMSMGIYGVVIGFLKLGFLLDLISLPVLSGFISAVAITIGLGQVGSLLGETGVRSTTAEIIHDIFHQLPTANGYACGVGFGTIVLLVILENVGKKWAATNRFAWFATITRAFLALVLFTGISYAVNKDRKHYLFDVAEIASHGITATVPSSSLLAKALPRSIAVFLGAAIEHTAIARSFGVKNGYVTDQTQEVNTYGVINLVNSFFGAMGVGGAMSRAAVNSQCRVKSPLSGFITTAVVLICIFELSDVLFWVPKATLSAIIICAVFPLISPPKVFYTYWKTSLADFLSSMISFWICLFVGTEYGIAASVGFNLVYIILRKIFAPVMHEAASSEPAVIVGVPASSLSNGIHPEVRVVHLTDSLFFANAYRTTTSILNIVQTYHSPAYGLPRRESAASTNASADASTATPTLGASTSTRRDPNRSWSVMAAQRLARLRRRAHITDPDALPPLRLLILDFSRVTHLDVTGLSFLRTLLASLVTYAGPEVQVRLAGLAPNVRERFARSTTPQIVDYGSSLRAPSRDEQTAAAKDGDEVARPLVCFTTVDDAIRAFGIDRSESVYVETKDGVDIKEATKFEVV